MIVGPFRATDPIYSGAAVRAPLWAAGLLVGAAGWLFGSLDATVVAQSPRLAPHIPAMQAHLAADLDLDPGAVNVKAKTSEKLGFAGRGEGIEAHAVLMLFAR